MTCSYSFWRACRRVRVLFPDANVGGEVPTHTPILSGGTSLLFVSQDGAPSSFCCLSGQGGGRSPQQTLGADVFVNVRPMDAVAAPGNLPVAPLLGGGMEQPGIPRERD